MTEALRCNEHYFYTCSHFCVNIDSATLWAQKSFDNEIFGTLKYSIRQLLIVTIPVAIYFACVASAVRGSAVGQGLAFAIPTIVIWFAAMAAVYWLAFAFSKMGHRWFKDQSSTPSTRAEVDSNDSCSTTELRTTDADTSSIEASP